MQKIFSNEKLDSFFGLKKHHRFIMNEPRYRELLEEFEKGKMYLKEGETDGGIFDHIYAIRRVNNIKKTTNLYYGNILDICWFQGEKDFQTLISWCKNFAKNKNGKLGKILISCITPGGQVKPHFDRGLYFGLYDRYHLVLKSSGSIMISGGQKQIYREGDVWWFNNKTYHVALNDTQEERIHVIFDILPNNYLLRIKNFLYWFYLGLRPGRLWRFYFFRNFPHF